MYSFGQTQGPRVSLDTAKKEKLYILAGKWVPILRPFTLSLVTSSTNLFRLWIQTYYMYQPVDRTAGSLETATTLYEIIRWHNVGTCVPFGWPLVLKPEWRSNKRFWKKVQQVNLLCFKYWLWSLQLTSVSCLCWEKQTVPCLWPPTDVFQM